MESCQQGNLFEVFSVNYAQWDTTVSSHHKKNGIHLNKFLSQEMKKVNAQSRKVLTFQEYEFEAQVIRWHTGEVPPIVSIYNHHALLSLLLLWENVYMLLMWLWFSFHCRSQHWMKPWSNHFLLHSKILACWSITAKCLAYIIGIIILSLSKPSLQVMS